MEIPKKSGVYCFTNLINGRKQKEKRLKLFPKLYWECDECFDLVNIRNKICKKCGVWKNVK